MALAQRTPSTIINMDASQVYRDLQILSARPSLEEMGDVPHRLFGSIDGAESCTAARWAEQAKAAIAEAQAAARLPILVGGTGLYMRTLLDGIAPVPDIEPVIRKAVRALSVTEAYAALQKEDSQAAARLAPADASRIARALEVVRSTGQPLHYWQSERVGGINNAVKIVPLILLPPRDWLMARCDARFEGMVASGALDEVRALLARGLPPAFPVMRAIGVRELAAVLMHKSSIPAAIAAAQLATRQYAKRQYTWFRNQCPADWLRERNILNHDIMYNTIIKLYAYALTT